ncbi:MAG TPA: hypothetical protein VHK06_08200 [Candidatus Limnocylindria bacterium]|nr:hypothetical protein [Candidatus Limnocylindria bacterium]
MTSDRPSASGQLRIVLATTGTSHGAAIAEAMAARRLPLAGVVLERPSGRALLGRLDDIRRRCGWRSLLAAVWRRLRSRLARVPEPWRDATVWAYQLVLDRLAGDREAWVAPLGELADWWLDRERLLAVDGSTTP